MSSKSPEQEEEGTRVDAMRRAAGLTRASDNGTVRPTRYGVSRCIDPLRMTLEFDEICIEVTVHQAVAIMQSIASIMSGCLPSEYEMRVGLSEAWRSEKVR
jgi:hypothetical protein